MRAYSRIRPHTLRPVMGRWALAVLLVPSVMLPR